MEGKVCQSCKLVAPIILRDAPLIWVSACGNAHECGQPGSSPEPLGCTAPFWAVCRCSCGGSLFHNHFWRFTSSGCRNRQGTSQAPIIYHIVKTVQCPKPPGKQKCFQGRHFRGFELTSCKVNAKVNSSLHTPQTLPLPKATSQEC